MVGDLDSEDFLKVIQGNILKQAVTEPTKDSSISYLVLGDLEGSDHKDITFNLDWAMTQTQSYVGAKF